MKGGHLEGRENLGRHLHTLIRNQIERKFSTAEQSYAGPGLSHGQIMDYGKFCYNFVDKTVHIWTQRLCGATVLGPFFFLAPATAAAILALAVMAGEEAEV